MFLSSLILASLCGLVLSNSTGAPEAACTVPASVDDIAGMSDVVARHAAASTPTITVTPSSVAPGASVTVKVEHPDKIQGFVLTATSSGDSSTKVGSWSGSAHKAHACGSSSGSGSWTHGEKVGAASIEYQLAIPLDAAEGEHMVRAIALVCTTDCTRDNLYFSLPEKAFTVSAAATNAPAAEPAPELPAKCSDAEKPNDCCFSKGNVENGCTACHGDDSCQFWRIGNTRVSFKEECRSVDAEEPALATKVTDVNDCSEQVEFCEEIEDCDACLAASACEWCDSAAKAGELVGASVSSGSCERTCAVASAKVEECPVPEPETMSEKCADLKTCQDCNGLEGCKWCDTAGAAADAFGLDGKVSSGSCETSCTSGVMSTKLEDCPAPEPSSAAALVATALPAVALAQLL